METAVHYPVIIVGGGQAGLSMSYVLKERGIDHVVLERDVVANAWMKKRWDSFCLVTPNWQCQLPGFGYSGKDPNGFMLRDEVVEYIRAYARSFEAPVVEGVEVTRLAQRRDREGYELETSKGRMTADQVVLAVGGYHDPKIPAYAQRLPNDVVQIHSAQYRNPGQFPDGAVLVVGTGQSGCQIAEDLHLAGRQVHLCTGGAPRVARRYRGRDVVEWLHLMGFYDLPVDKHPLKEGVRGRTNHYVTGREGGRDIDLRKFAFEGMKLYGRLLDITGEELRLGTDLQRNLDSADEVRASINRSIDAFIEKQGIEAPSEGPYVPVWQPTNVPECVNWRQAGIRAVIWSIGYRTNFGWVEVPIFDGRGYPGHRRGVTRAAGLYFLGLPWLHTWGSGRFSGIARDARYVGEHIVSLLSGEASGQGMVDEVALGS